MKYDFSGWATRNDILCTDGRTIRKDAFKDCDGKTVPLVWNHQHNDPENVLGKALLHNEEEGVRAYCSFNETRKAQSAKMAVEHGDIDSLSIYANHLKQEGGNVLHGEIKEVSLVYAGANSGAYIDDVIRHGELQEGEMIIYPNEELDLAHAELDDAKPAPKAVPEKPEEKKEDKPEEKAEDKDDEGNGETVGDVFNTLTEKQKKVVYALIGQALNEGKGGKDDEAKHADEEPEEKDDDSDDGETVGDVFNSLNEKQKKVVYALIGQALSGDNGSDNEAKHADDDADDDSDGETVGDVFNTLTEKQKKVVYALIGQALESAKEAKHSDEDDDEPAEDDESIKHSDNTEGGNKMERNRNIFEQGTDGANENYLSHSEQVDIINEARNGKASLRDVVLQHGITNINEAYPDYKVVGEQPQVIVENQDWVNAVLSGVHHTPFARIKTLFADLTADEARAKGYLTKGTEKIEEVLKLLKRETQPTTIYKFQKLDKDDVNDITDFDMVAWLKEEMRVMLAAEEARAILIGDGRGITAPDKIDEEKIRPIWKMEELFAIPAVATVPSTADANDIAKAVIRAAVKGFDDYDGSGNTTLFIASDKLSDMILLEDGFGHRLYKTKAELAAAMGVDKVVPVPVMKNKTRTVTIEGTDHTRNLIGIIVDLKDYNVGQTRGGQTSFFDDFDLNFNKLEYLLEKRESGTLVKPKSAIILEYEVSGN